jgi:hypothetical protein
MIFAAIILTSLPAVGQLAGDKDRPKANSPAEQLRALFAEHDRASRELYKPLLHAKTPEEEEKVYEEEKIIEKVQKLNAEYARRVLEFAEKHPKEQTIVGDALSWVVRNAEDTPEAARAADAIIHDHLNDRNPEIENLFGSLGYNPLTPAERLLRAAAEQVQDKERKARARYFLAQHLKNRADGVYMVKGLDEKTRKQIERVRGKESLDRLAAGDPSKLFNEAESIYEGLAADSGNVKVYGQSIKELVTSELFEIRNLAIGKVAPQIEGEDIDGKSFKLSDYRGKVVVLDFWGHW